MFFAMIYKIKLINRILKRDSLFHYEFISESSSHLHEAQCRVSLLIFIMLKLPKKQLYSACTDRDNFSRGEGSDGHLSFPEGGVLGVFLVIL